MPFKKYSTQILKNINFTVIHLSDKHLSVFTSEKARVLPTAGDPQKELIFTPDIKEQARVEQ